MNMYHLKISLNDKNETITIDNIQEDCIVSEASFGIINRICKNVVSKKDPAIYIVDGRDEYHQVIKKGNIWLFKGEKIIPKVVESSNVTKEEKTNEPGEKK